MTRIIIFWMLVGIIISFLKIYQSRHLGFHRPLTFSTLPFIALGIIIWPLILFYIYQEYRIHRVAKLQSRLERSDLDKEMDEIEKAWEKLEKNDCEKK